MSSEVIGVDQQFPNFCGWRTTEKFSVVDEKQNIDLYTDSRTTKDVFADHQQTLGVTGVDNCFAFRLEFCLLNTKNCHETATLMLFE